MKFEQKKEAVKNLHDKFSKAVAVIVADFNGLDVAGMTELRKACRNNAIEYFVSKNTLVRRAVKDTEFGGMEEHLTGINSIGISYEDPVILAKTVQDFAKANENFKIKYGYLARGNTMLEPEQVKILADVPPREVLLTRLVSAMISPHREFVTVLNEVMGKFVRTLEAVRAKKEEAN